MKDVQNLMEDIRNWSDCTFGVSMNSATPVHHLKKEVGELIEAIDKKLGDSKVGFEFADCFILLLNSASKYGFTFENIYLFAISKMQINKKRRWGLPDADGVCHHLGERKTALEVYKLSELIEGDIFQIELDPNMVYRHWGVMPNTLVNIRWKPSKSKKCGWIETCSCFDQDSDVFYLGHEEI